MAPRSPNEAEVLDTETFNPHEKEVLPPREYKIVWGNVIRYIILHAFAIYGLYLAVFSARFYTFIWALFLCQIGVLGVTAGAHRLWSHRAFKAKLPLEITLMLLQTMAFQDSVLSWVKNHRLHHKYSDTDADPHNAKRGFFYSHMGWLMCRSHPEVRIKKSLFDFSDIENDPVLSFQRRHYFKLLLPVGVIIPIFVPVYFWQESVYNAFFVNFFRYVACLHCVWLVNSAAHLYGNRPYDKTIYPAQNIQVSVLAMGEGYHNYHHAFPWDYRGSEFGRMYFNSTTVFIDLMAKIGWAYDLKTTTDKTLKSKVLKFGDGSHKIWGHLKAAQEEGELECSSKDL